MLLLAPKVTRSAHAKPSQTSGLLRPLSHPASSWTAQRGLLRAIPLARGLASEAGPYDLAVIGGGPGGYVAAVKAAQLGYKVRFASSSVLSVPLA